MSLTVIIIILTVVVSVGAWNRPELHYKLMMNPYSVTKRGQFYRMITSGFVHNNWMHLGFNMFTFYFFARNVEYLLAAFYGNSSPYYFLVFYTLGIVISDIPSLLKHNNNPHYNSLGASGGVSSMVFCNIMFFPLEKIYLFAIVPIPGFILGILYLIYSYYEGKRMAGNVNHHAHLVGGLFGIAFSIYMQPTVLLTFFEKILTKGFI